MMNQKKLIKGSALVEMVVMLPLFISLIFFTIYLSFPGLLDNSAHSHLHHQELSTGLPPDTPLFNENHDDVLWDLQASQNSILPYDASFDHRQSPNFDQEVSSINAHMVWASVSASTNVANNPDQDVNISDTAESDYFSETFNGGQTLWDNQNRLADLLNTWFVRRHVELNRHYEPWFLSMLQGDDGEAQGIEALEKSYRSGNLRSLSWEAIQNYSNIRSYEREDLDTFLQSLAQPGLPAETPTHYQSGQNFWEPN